MEIRIYSLYSPLTRNTLINGPRLYNLIYGCLTFMEILCPDENSEGSDQTLCTAASALGQNYQGNVNGSPCVYDLTKNLKGNRYARYNFVHFVKGRQLV